MPLVLGRKCQRNAEIWPFDAERRIIKAHAHICCRAVEVVALVAKERVILKNYKAVCKTARDEKLPPIFGAKRNRHMLAESGRTLADIDGDIPNRAFDDANELGLRMRSRLPMETTDNAFG